jgi:hypothetical protein
VLIILITLLSFHEPRPEVATGSIEAVYVPAGWTGPIVAAPFSERVLGVSDE